ncbi:MAG: tRNA dihydrouridine(20/20a) synthase DusA [Rhodospirillaceae bacterium]|nr:tRNA dihydrouridine(20/20a) synthase DusA [Rhodospirillaceae bacterium]
MIDRRLSIAPMMGCTDRHDRYFLRLITRRALLYTEMVTTGAVLHGDRQRLLGFHPAEKPLALQLGGSDADALGQSAAIAESFDYDEINLNVGCPSDRVQSGRFGACLMAEPDLVADCVATMRRATALPVTVKTRIGIDDRDSFEELCRFVDTVAATGCDTFIVHARKAWLQGLSPKQNREIPPLRYDVVYRLKEAFPGLTIAINGGITTIDAAEEHLRHVDGVMIGREAYQNPYFLAEADRRLLGLDADILKRKAVLDALMPYVEEETSAGVPLKHITRHIVGLFQGVPGGRAWRRYLSEHAHKPGADAAVIREAAALAAE